jgi:NAD-dependent deacetylase
MQVYPAAGLVDYANITVPIVYIDLNPARLPSLPNPITVMAKTASAGLRNFMSILPELLGN